MQYGSRGKHREDICNHFVNQLGMVELLLMGICNGSSRMLRSSHSTSASRGSRRRTSALSSSGGATPPSEGPSTEPVTPIPPIFQHSSSSTFHEASMGPPSEGFFTNVFGPYTSMMSGSSSFPIMFYSSALMFSTSVPPLVVYQPSGS
ncbi:hypothetical protein V6N13_074617 [Hibiscus sabdariffa]